MTDTQHTPGPWRIGDAGFTVFGPPKPGALPETIAPVKNRANARLIAAAPELLAALEAVADYWAGGDVPEALDTQMRAAIIKATGAQS